MTSPNGGTAGGNPSERDDVPFSLDVQLFKRPKPEPAEAQTSRTVIASASPQKLRTWPSSLSAASVSTDGVAAIIWKRLSWKQAPVIVGGCIATAALIASSYLLIFARSPEQAAVDTSMKSDFLPSTVQPAAAVKGSPPIVQQTTTSGRTDLQESLVGGKQKLKIAEHPTTVNLSDAQNWIAVKRSQEFQTYFLKDVKGKGSSDARVSMLTNFATTQSLPKVSAGYSSLLYVISIDCRTSTGGPVEVFWNTGQFLSGEYLNNPMPSLKQKQFAGDDPLLRFACN